MTRYKKDLILSIAIFVIAFTMLAAYFVSLGHITQDGVVYAAVYISGEMIKKIDLDHDDIFTIDTRYGQNTLCVRNGMIAVTDSDCRGKDCVHMGYISHSGEFIACLPHELFIKIEGENASKKGGIDAFAY